MPTYLRTSALPTWSAGYRSRLPTRWSALKAAPTFCAVSAALVASKPEIFGRFDTPRPGGLFDRLAMLADDRRLPAPTILAELLQELGPIWPSRLTLGGIALGDCWKHAALTTADATSGLVPLHKLSQWLAYSLIEPLQTSGLSVTDIDGLTGLAEYRNGGLFVDIGVLAFRDADAAQKEHQVASPLVVEWRALTVALLDRVADGMRQPAPARRHLAAASEDSRGRDLGRRPTIGARAPR